MPTCSSCSQAAPDEAVTCPACGQPMRSPCPLCGELILLQAIKCKFCKTLLQDGPVVDAREIERIRKELGSLTVEADAPADTRSQPGKISVGTLILSLLSIASVLTAVFGGMRNNEPLLVTGVVFSIVFGLFWLFVLGVDLSVPSSRGRQTGRKAVKCYLQAVRYRRWRTAWACLSPIARSRPEVAIPHFPGLNEPGRYSSFSTSGGLAAYWRYLIHTTSMGTARRILRYTLEPRDSTDPNIQRFHVSMKVEYYPSWIWLLILVALLLAVLVYLIVRRTIHLDFDMVVYKHRSQWWILTGEAGSPIDRELV